MGLVPPATPAAAATTPALDHVFVIVMENHGYSQLIGSSSAPYLNSLLPSGGLAANYFAVTHPSLPNYLAMVGGSTYGITSDCTTCWVNASNIADSVESAGKSWKTYQESMPSACFVGDSYPYAQKHNPFIYFNDVRNNAARCQSHVVPYTQLSTDLRSAASTPNYAFITPNMCNDTHDCTVATGDSWLKQQVPLILASPAFTSQRSILSIVWDEDDSSGTNQVPMVMLGSGVSAAYRSSVVYNHYSLLRTFEQQLGLATLTANDLAASSMSDFFSLSGWSLVGGVITSNPGASSWGATRTDLFVRGTDSALWHRPWNGTTWGNWESLGGLLTSDPTAVSWATNRIDVFVRGTDNALWHRSSDGTAWSGWDSMGGILTSGPSAASRGTNGLDVFVTGTDNHGLWQATWNGSRWSWTSLGGISTSDPGAVASSSGRIDVFVRGTDQGLWQNTWNGTSWQWTSLGGVLTSTPAASSCSSGHVDVFLMGTDHGIWRRGFNGSAWGGWTSMGGVFGGEPGAVCQPATTSVQLFERGPEGAVYQSSATGI